MKEMRGINVITLIEGIKCISQAGYELSFTQRLILLVIGGAIPIFLLKIALKRYYENELTEAYAELDSVKKEKEKIEKKLEKVNESIKEKEKEISILKEEIKKKDDMIADYQEKMKKLENIMGYAKKLKEEKEELERLIEEKEEEIERLRESIPYQDEEYYGDLSYWTGKKLYELKHRFPNMSYRKMEEITGVSKSTIQKRVSKYMEQMDRS